MYEPDGYVVDSIAGIRISDSNNSLGNGDLDRLSMPDVQRITLVLLARQAVFLREILSSAQSSPTDDSVLRYRVDLLTEAVTELTKGVKILSDVILGAAPSERHLVFTAPSLSREDPEEIPF